MTDVPAKLFFETRSAASIAAAGLMQAALMDGLEQRGAASLMVSGGSTPGPAFAALSKAEIDWTRITIGLVDERFVPPDHDASNEGLVRRTLLQHQAAAATFLSMWRDTHSFADIGPEVSDAYEAALPADMVLLGMGTDGHTASWFPEARNLGAALAEDAPPVIVLDATGAPVAGDMTERVTLTLPAIASARAAILLIFGEDKRDVLGGAPDKPIHKAASALGQRLTIIWAP